MHTLRNTHAAFYFSHNLGHFELGIAIGFLENESLILNTIDITLCS